MTKFFVSRVPRARSMALFYICENKATMCWLPHQKIKETFLMTSHLLYTSDLTPPFLSLSLSLSLIKESCSIAAAAAECKVCLRKNFIFSFVPASFPPSLALPFSFSLSFYLFQFTQVILRPCY